MDRSYICIYKRGGTSKSALDHLYSGSRCDMPEELKEEIALIDASDDNDVNGVGNCAAGYIYTLDDVWGAG